MYRNDLDATFARANVLQNELAAAKNQAVLDQQRIAMLQDQLATMQKTIERLGGNRTATAPIYASRSGTILTLGICAVAVCSILGPIAWVMGNEELRRMRAGQTPSDAWSSVVAGRVLGIVGTALIAVAVLVIVTVVSTMPTHHSHW